MKHTNGKHSATAVRETPESEQAQHLAHALVAVGHQQADDIETVLQLRLEPLHRSLDEFGTQLDQQRDLFKGTAEKTRRRVAAAMRENFDQVLAETREQGERIAHLENALVQVRTELAAEVAEVRAQLNERCDHMIATLDGHTDALNEVLMRVGRVCTKLENAPPQKPKWSIIPARLRFLRPLST